MYFLHIQCVISTHSNGFEYVITTYWNFFTEVQCMFFTHPKLLSTTYSQPVDNFFVYIPIFFAKIREGKNQKNNSIICPFGHSL